MINSIYTHKEIFLRELISNASDAIDKLYFRSLTDNTVGMNKDQFEIRIDLSEDNRTLKISDNGIGMTADELENNLGVIAQSGSQLFKKENSDSEDIDIIGQFGVGFYSAFMVSDKIVVESKAFGADTAYKPFYIIMLIFFYLYNLYVSAAAHPCPYKNLLRHIAHRGNYP